MAAQLQPYADISIPGTISPDNWEILIFFLQKNKRFKMI